jgi:putative endonuclease
MMKRIETGKLGEKLAREYLEAREYSILETNYRSPAGEIDIVARQGDCLVFIEVRTKRNGRFGAAEESLTPRKQQHLIDSVAFYCQSLEKAPAAFRIDFIAVELDKNDRPFCIRIIQDAVTENEYFDNRKG